MVDVNIGSGPRDLNEIFLANSYQFEQPYLQILTEGYQIKGDNNESYAAVRSRRVLRVLFAKTLAGLVFFSSFFGSLILFVAWNLASMTQLSLDPLSVSLFFIELLISFILSLLLYFASSRLLLPRRMILVKNCQGVDILKVIPVSGYFLFTHKYEVLDAFDRVYATITRNYFNSFFRTKWHCYGPEGTLLITAIEDSLIRSLLRRCFRITRLFPMHFYFVDKAGLRQGDFIRRWSIKDKYKLNFQAGAFAPWLAVAISLVLDTGEDR